MIVGVIGLGYVGLPLAVELGKKFKTFGFDISLDRIQELNRSFDKNSEITDIDFLSSKHLSFTNKINKLVVCDIYIITVPTPVSDANIPDTSCLVDASTMVSPLLSHGNIVVYESTVYPGVTEDICIPALEKFSNLRCDFGAASSKKQTFSVGYSPERINPGDNSRKLIDINKIVSASNKNALRILSRLYTSIISNASIYCASSIKVAEAAKVIENTQRDVNIALINELAMLFQKLKIDSNEVLKAASTKWNFLNFKPGLVGGHCIGVDPYYLKYKAESVGFHAEIITAGRKINDLIPGFIFRRVMNLIVSKKVNLTNIKIGILGITFKEDCPDLRNTKVIDIYNKFVDIGIKPDCFDPIADPKDAKKYYGIRIRKKINFENYDVLIFAVNHKEYVNLDFKQLKVKLKKNCIVYDVKSFLPGKLVTERL